MDKYLFFSGDKPTIEDENFSRDALIQAILDRAGDFFTDGTVDGFTLAKDSSELVVSAGVAYVSGERIASTTEIREAYPATDKYVFVQYTLTDGSPKTHHITQASHDTRRVHGIAVVLRDTATPLAKEVLVGRALATGEVEDLRAFCQVAPDPRMHDPNTDTHTTASTFKVGGSTGSEVLTVQDAISQQPELELLFRSGLINLQDGHGDRLIETQKIPSEPKAPVLSADNLTLKVNSMAPEKDVALRSALENYQAAKVSTEAVDTQIALATSYRSLVNQKRLKGYSLGQIRGEADVNGAKDNDVRDKKNEMILAGAAGVEREAGTLSISSGSALVTGNGTSIGSGMAGKRILLHAEGLEKEYTVQTVDVAQQQLTLTEVATETEAAAYFYLAEAESLGFSSAVTSGAEMIAMVDAMKAGKESARAKLIEDKVAHGNTVLTLYQEDDDEQNDSYSMLLTWAKPELVDLEEIRRYRVLVYELNNSRTQLPTGITKGELESGHVDIIFRVSEDKTIERQKVEEQDAADLTAAGSTVSLVKVTGAGNFQANTRIEVGGESRIIKAYNQGEKTVELLTPLPNPPAAGQTVTSYRISWDGDVITERYSRLVRPGQQLVIYAQTVSEFEVVSPWSSGLVIRTDDLADAAGKKLEGLVAERMDAKKLRFEVERDRLALEYKEQILALQRALAEAVSQDQMDNVVDTVEAMQTS